VLVGRDLDTAHLADLLKQARHGSSASLVVRGEPGVGKSALLEALVANAGEALILRTQGLEAEAPLAFAALQRLLLPVLRLRDELPLPQARALRVAFGEEDGPSIEPFLVAVATLSILTSAAEQTTVLCVVEDAHWLDSATADALLFCRDAVPPDGIPELQLTGLDRAGARELLDQRLGDSRAPEVTERLIAESNGNPLALLELPTELSPDQLRGASPLPAQLHLTTRVERAFLDRNKLLPPSVQSLLLLAAADDTGALAVVRRAASTLGLGEQALEAAVTSGLLITDAESVKVRHPLVRSAVYQAATGEQRRRVHQALADALAGLGDSDREAWHRAAAAEGPDPRRRRSPRKAAGHSKRPVGCYVARSPEREYGMRHHQSLFPAASQIGGLAESSSPAHRGPRRPGPQRSTAHPVRPVAHHDDPRRHRGCARPEGDTPMRRYGRAAVRYAAASRGGCPYDEERATPRHS
jgi:hypothetical protein